VITNSRLATHRDCPRRHQIAYAYGLRPTTTPEAMAWGTAWHAGIAREPITGDPYLVAAVISCLARYDPRPIARYVAVEEPAYLTMPSGEVYAGVVDAIVELDDGRLAVLERKTTATLDADYWRKVELDSQVAGYFHLARSIGYDVQTVLYDVVERPGERPLKATPIDKRKYKKDGTLYANQREVDETPDEYAERVACRFEKREVPITAQRIAEWWRDVQDQVAVLGTTYRNSSACARRGAVCPYLACCHRSDLDTYTPDGFVRLSDVHPEFSQAVAYEQARAGQAAQLSAR
jgi:hypothetical protein